MNALIKMDFGVIKTTSDLINYASITNNMAVCKRSKQKIIVLL